MVSPRSKRNRGREEDTDTNSVRGQKWWREHMDFLCDCFHFPSEIKEQSHLLAKSEGMGGAEQLEEKVRNNSLRRGKGNGLGSAVG